MTTRPLHRYGIGAGAAHCGFTLIEVAIGLGVVGLLCSGIWVAAESAIQTDKVNQSIEMISMVTQGVRDQMQDRPFSAIGDITQNMINDNVIPAWTIVNGVAENPWGDGGHIHILADGLQTFSIEFAGQGVIPSDICTRVVLRVAQCNITDMACPQSVRATTGVALPGGTPPSLTFIPSTTLTLATVEGVCASARNLNFQYKL
jgi:prepilin-type N-terminal cleavage/methylation domain-containing protein